MTNFTAIAAGAMFLAGAQTMLATNATEDGFLRTVMLEEFTTEKCSNCPPAAPKLHNVINYPDYAGRLAVVCHHIGFNTDWLTLPTDKDYIWLYNSGGSEYAPALMIDRVPTLSETSAVFGLTVPTEEDIRAEIDKRLAVPSTVSIAARVSVSADSVVTVNVTGERTPGENGKIMVTVYLVENNIQAHNQSGASDGFVHQHVTRAYNKTWGEQIKWNGNSYTYSCEFKLDNTWKRQDMEIVAMVNRDVPSNVLACEVVNATTVPLETSGISEVSADAAIPVAYYDLQGTKLTKEPDRGFYITVYSDGTARKAAK